MEKIAAKFVSNEEEIFGFTVVRKAFALDAVGVVTLQD
jgi:hypothetical protein